MYYHGKKLISTTTEGLTPDDVRWRCEYEEYPFILEPGDAAAYKLSLHQLDPLLDSYIIKRDLSIRFAAAFVDKGTIPEAAERLCEGNAYTKRFLTWWLRIFFHLPDEETL